MTTSMEVINLQDWVGKCRQTDQRNIKRMDGHIERWLPIGAKHQWGDKEKEDKGARGITSDEAEQQHCSNYKGQNNI